MRSQQHQCTGTWLKKGKVTSYVLFQLLVVREYYLLILGRVKRLIHVIYSFLPFLCHHQVYGFVFKMKSLDIIFVTNEPSNKTAILFHLKSFNYWCIDPRFFYPFPFCDYLVAAVYMRKCNHSKFHFSV